MGVIIKNNCNNEYLLYTFLSLYFKNWLDIIVLENIVIKSLMMICGDKIIQ